MLPPRNVVARLKRSFVCNPLCPCITSHLIRPCGAFGNAHAICASVSCDMTRFHLHLIWEQIGGTIWGRIQPGVDFNCALFVPIVG